MDLYKRLTRLVDKKFNLDDIVFTMDNYRITKGKIKKIVTENFIDKFTKENIIQKYYDIETFDPYKNQYKYKFQIDPYHMFSTLEDQIDYIKNHHKEVNIEYILDEFNNEELLRKSLLNQKES